MCLPAIGMVAGLAGSAVSAMGSMAAANAQASQDEYNAQVAKINARSRRWEGYSKQEEIGMKADKLQGQQIANAAKSGIDPTFGSAALLIFGEGAEMEAKDKANAYQTAESAATGEENKAKAYEQSAAAHRQAGAIGAAGSFLSGLAGATKSFSGGANNPLFIG